LRLNVTLSGAVPLRGVAVRFAVGAVLMGPVEVEVALPVVELVADVVPVELVVVLELVEDSASPSGSVQPGRAVANRTAQAIARRARIGLRLRTGFKSVE
jgi:hypothetical protein